eukprot:6198584-Ditylum_brightwellii.AAC.2
MNVEIEQINNHELCQGKPKLSRLKTRPAGSLGLIFIDHGSNRDAWWDCNRFKIQWIGAQIAVHPKKIVSVLSAE